MIQQDPGYCNWVMDTVQNAGQEIEGAPHLQRMAQYIQSSRMQETYEAQDSDLDMERL